MTTARAITKPIYPLFVFKKYLLLFLFSIVFSLTTLCVFQLNSYIQDVYSIKGLESKIAQIGEENRVLEIRLSKAGSLANIENYIQDKIYIQNQVFEKASKVEYVQILENTVAVK